MIGSLRVLAESISEFAKLRRSTLWLHQNQVEDAGCMALANAGRA